MATIKKSQIDKLINKSLKTQLKEERMNFDLDAPYAVFMSGGYIGQSRTVPGLGVLIFTTDDIDEAKTFIKRKNASLSPGEKSYFKMKYSLVKLTDSIRKRINATGIKENANANILEMDIKDLKSKKPIITEGNEDQDAIEASKQINASMKTVLKSKDDLLKQLKKLKTDREKALSNYKKYKEDKVKSKQYTEELKDIQNQMKAIDKKLNKVADSIDNILARDRDMNIAVTDIDKAQKDIKGELSDDYNF